MDHRLREAPDVRDAVISLLEDLAESIQDCRCAYIITCQHIKFGIIERSDFPGYYLGYLFFRYLGWTGFHHPV